MSIYRLRNIKTSFPRLASINNARIKQTKAEETIAFVEEPISVVTEMTEEEVKEVIQEMIDEETVVLENESVNENKKRKKKNKKYDNSREDTASN